MISKKVFTIVLALVLATPVKTQNPNTSGSDMKYIHTDDISHFWKALDALRNQQTTADSIRIIKEIFVDSASEGLREYMKAAGCFETQYLEAIKSRESDYGAVRKTCEADTNNKEQIAKMLKKFRQLYPELKLTDICFSMGKFEVGGSQFPHALYIGTEVDALHHVDIIAQTMHELAHYQQKDQDPQTNLEMAMIEGGAEFVNYQVTGVRTIYSTWDYGIHHENELWQEFKPLSDSSIQMQWFMDVPDKKRQRPGSLGYFIGFRICESYLKNQTDKKVAMKILIEMNNPKEIFLISKYEPESLIHFIN
jgi:hypothetical protein